MEEVFNKICRGAVFQFESQIENGYITQDDLHVGRYGLTDIGVKTVVVLRKIEKE